MDSIDAIGFDMDYTLARYFRQPIENLAYTMTIDRLDRSRLPKRYPYTRFPMMEILSIRGLNRR